MKPRGKLPAGRRLANNVINGIIGDALGAKSEPILLALSEGGDLGS